MHRAESDDYRLIGPLTGLRAFAALWVFSRHFFAGGHYDCGFGLKVELGAALPVVILGGWGVDLFFVISGFVMLHVYGDRMNAGLRRVDAVRFYVLRWGRMYPLHFAILVGMAVGYAVDLLPWDGRKFEFTYQSRTKPAGSVVLYEGFTEDRQNDAKNQSLAGDSLWLGVDKLPTPN